MRDHHKTSFHLFAEHPFEHRARYDCLLAPADDVHVSLKLVLDILNCQLGTAVVFNLLRYDHRWVNAFYARFDNSAEISADLFEDFSNFVNASRPVRTNVL